MSIKLTIHNKYTNNTTTISI